MLFEVCGLLTAGCGINRDREYDLYKLTNFHGRKSAVRSWNLPDVHGGTRGVRTAAYAGAANVTENGIRLYIGSQTSMEGSSPCEAQPCSSRRERVASVSMDGKHEQ